MEAVWVALVGVAGAAIGALVTGFFTLTAPLRLEERKARNEVTRGQLDAIQETRTASILWLDHLEGAIMDLHHGIRVDPDEFRAVSRSHLESLSRNKYAHVGDRTTLLERLREADRCVRIEIAEQPETPEPPGTIAPATYWALNEAFSERARFTPTMTGQTREMLRRLGHRE